MHVLSMYIQHRFLECQVATIEIFSGSRWTACTKDGSLGDPKEGNKHTISLLSDTTQHVEHTWQALFIAHSQQTSTRINFPSPRVPIPL